MQLWDIVSPADLTVFARTLPDEFPDSLDRFLPDRLIAGIKSRIAKKTRTNVVAQYRAYNAETPIGNRPISVAVTEVLLPPVGHKLMLTEWERLSLDAAHNGGTALDEMVATVYDDVENSVRAVRNRAELARGDFLTDGKFTLAAENGLTIEADFGLAAVTSCRRRGAGPVDPRTINRVSRRRCPGRRSRPSITNNSSRTAASPFPRTGWWTVVSGGSVDWASSMSSKPTRLISPGIVPPSRRIARRAPIAIASLIARIAVGRRPLAHSRPNASIPPAIVAGPTATSSAATAIPASASVSR